MAGPSTPSTCGSVASTGCRPSGSWRRSRPASSSARELALDTVRWVAGFDFPDHEWSGELVALRSPGEYPITRGRLVSTLGLDIGPEEFEHRVVEDHVEHSTALHARLVERGEYLLGPLARFALNAHELSPVALDAAAEAGLSADERNPFRSIVVRAVEVLYACDEALSIIGRYREPDRPAVDGAAPGGGRLRLDRGSSRDAVAPVRGGCRGHHHERADRPTDLAEPGGDRARPVPLRRRAPRTWPMRSSATAPSRSSATTTRASPAQRTSSTSRSTGRDRTQRGDRGGKPLPARRRRRLGRGRGRRSAARPAGPGTAVRWRDGPAARRVDRRRLRGGHRRHAQRGRAGDDPHGGARGGAGASPPPSALTPSGSRTPWRSARALDRLPERLVVVGIEAGDTGFGDGLSPRVAAAVAQAVDLIARCVQEDGAGLNARRQARRGPAPRTW